LAQLAWIDAGIAQPIEAMTDELRGWPGPLIAVVFAGLLIEKSEKRFGEAIRGAALAGIMVWIIVLGQVALGLLATWLVIAPHFDVPPAFGQLIAAGFAGGHGTAAALGTIYRDLLEFPPGLDLGLFMATIGLIYSLISGIVLINIAVRRGWTRSGDARAERISGLEQRSNPSPAALARVGGEVIDPMAFQIVILAMAFLVGVALQWLFIAGAELVLDAETMDYVRNVPLFLFTLIGGWTIRHAMTLLGVGDLIDSASIKRLVAIAMEFLIVAAISSLRIDVVVSFIGPLLLLCVLGFVWTAVCLLILSRLVLPRAYWFELGILNYGMSTGTTAQGLLLLRIIDRDFESGAAEDYALAAPLSAPFIGGGVLTMSLPLILAKLGLPFVTIMTTTIVAGLLALGWWINNRRTAASG
jgi:ESS family glutamate:Na+ symporter